MVTATATKPVETATPKAAPLDFSALADPATAEKFVREVKPVEIPATVQSRYDASKDGEKILAQPLPSPEHATRFVTLLKRCAKQDNPPMRVRASIKDTTVTFQVKPIPAPTADAAK